jgi:soluble lytic murein transglycosylase-like protein
MRAGLYRWITPQGARRRRKAEQARLQALHGAHSGHIVHSIEATLRLAAVTFLWSILCVFTLAIAACACAFAQGIPREAQRYQLTLKREAQYAWGLQAPVATFAAQVHQESHWRSPVGAVGLAQFMPATAQWIAPTLNSCKPEAAPGQECLAGFGPTNPTWSLRAMVTYDKWLADRVRADDECQDLAYALSAYNGGLGWVYKRQKLSAKPGVCLGLTCAINPGITPAAQQENQHYPELILLKYQPLYQAWGKGVCQ